MSEKRYLVIDDRKNGDGFCDVYDTLEEANAAAERDWGYLTEQERKNRHIWVGEVFREGLDDDAIDEDTGEVDWRCWHHCGTPAGAFDSENLK